MDVIIKISVIANLKIRNKRKVVYMPILLTAEELADLFRIKLATVYAWKFYGKIKAVKVGGRLLFKQEDVLALIEEAA